eukprot:scaffold15357_cov79-Phaeocystis_antarctica.AAC.3
MARLHPLGGAAAVARHVHQHHVLRHAVLVERLAAADDDRRVVRGGGGKGTVARHDLGCHGTWYAYVTAEAGTRTAYVQCVAPRGKLPCASGAYSTQSAGTHSLYVLYGGSGTYVSAQAATSPSGRKSCRAYRKRLSSFMTRWMTASTSLSVRMLSGTGTNAAGLPLSSVFT